ncbi:hypothetical protein FSP39_015210 [Pinctada imbricata]|uniref:Mab-21-like HhH/H2TH-like domain-containing protein n=1 Tax=Pinctada imbricata TaxID=66713 RepID=A0AA88YMV0_PINIB|nr:hypothetical protein FSP39_015210 [Pinctada imbricata]
MSGSRCEGFDFESSDYDLMMILKMYKVINPTQEYHQQITDHNVFVLENVRPGFVRLRGLGGMELPCLDDQMLLTRQGEELYLSSRKVKEYHNRLYQWDFHGPCLSTLDGSIDFALALSSDTWPHEAVGCVHRLLKRGWPSVVVIREMVKDGCLFVPVGCKTSPHEDIEWRMSFSLAEKCLVRSMNHTQFLTYALLKLFLKDVVEKETIVSNLLCSYHMKTLVFWEIISTDIPWSPSFLLDQFWNCFRRLLCWIKNEHCPNFFVPENNLFFGKFHGNTRQRLLKFLCSCYRFDHSLLRIPFIQCKMERLKSNEGQNVSYSLSRSIVTEKLLRNILFDIPLKETLETLESSPSTFVAEFCQYLRLFRLNISYFSHLCTQSSNIFGNRAKYTEEKVMFRLIKASSPDRIQSKLFLAIYFYMCKRYDKCVRLLRKALYKIADKETIYTWDFDENKYSSLGGDLLPTSKGMFRYTASYIPLDSYTAIPEISPECNNTYNTQEFQIVPPLVLTRFLLFLCRFRGGNIKRAHRHMTKLQYFRTSHPNNHGTYIMGNTGNMPTDFRRLSKCINILY